MKKVVTAATAIHKIDPSSTKFLAQTKAARKQVNKLKGDYTKLYNYELFLEYEQQAPIAQKISNLKLKNPKLITAAKEARIAYEELPKKQFVLNFKKIEEMETFIIPAKAITTAIDALENPTIAQIKVIRDDITALTKQERKYLYNIKKLANFEKTYKAAMTAEQSIANIDPAGLKFVSQVKSAMASYKKVKEPQKHLVTNAQLLSEYEPQMKVYEQIARLKLTSPKLISEAALARAAYDALTNKQPITNVYALENAEKAVQKAVVIAEKIAELEANATLAIQEARNLYNALTKQEKRYVTNIKVLTSFEK